MKLQSCLALAHTTPPRPPFLVNVDRDMRVCGLELRMSVQDSKSKLKTRGQGEVRRIAMHSCPPTMRSPISSVNRRTTSSLSIIISLFRCSQLALLVFSLRTARGCLAKVLLLSVRVACILCTYGACFLPLYLDAYFGGGARSLSLSPLRARALSFSLFLSLSPGCPCPWFFNMHIGVVAFPPSQNASNALVIIGRRAEDVDAAAAAPWKTLTQVESNKTCVVLELEQRLPALRLGGGHVFHTSFKKHKVSG